jgi:hypothetical protein
MPTSSAVTCRRRALSSIQCSKLAQHRQIIADGPPFGDPAVGQPVGERGVSGGDAWGTSNPMNDPPGQCRSRGPNCTTMSPSATTTELIQRPGCVARPALRRNSRVPSRPCRRPAASAWLTMSGVHSDSSTVRSPPLLPSSSKRATTALLCATSMTGAISRRRRPRHPLERGRQPGTNGRTAGTSAGSETAPDAPGTSAVPARRGRRRRCDSRA